MQTCRQDIELLYVTFPYLYWFKDKVKPLDLIPTQLTV